jgi:ubiquinone/menaquinone biosynthesis C-methylase UbiE
MKEAREITKQEIIESYNRTFAESDYMLRDVDGLYRWVLKKLNPQADTRLLDIACGRGILLKHAQDWKVRSYGIDISHNAAEHSKKESPQSDVFVGDGECLPFPDGYFDFITNLGSLEHFLDIQQGLNEMQRVMKPDGLAAIFLPNSYYLVDIIWKVLRTGYSVSHRQVLERFATYNEWGDLIKESGFQIVKGYKYNHVFPYTAADLGWYWKHPKRIFLTMASPFVPFHLSYHFLYICKRTT